jgi:S1-C subfamily serine protease
MKRRIRLAVLAAAAATCLCCTVALAKEQAQDLRRTPVVRAVQEASPAVVNIKAAKRVEREASPFSSLLRRDLPPFFQDILPRRKHELVRRSLGSGVIIDGGKRFVLTNAHVITGASEITVRLLDGRSFSAELVGSDPDFDLALLKLSGKQSLPEVKLGSSDDLLIGEPVVAIGNPYGFSHTVTTGVISALKRTVETKRGTYMGFIQTDAAVNPGNSGGPLLNILGEVIGITTAIYAKAQGIGFAIPIDKAKRVVEELMRFGTVRSVWLGLSGQNVDQRMASYFGLQEARGMLVTRVHEASPAASAGISSGDVVLALKDIAVQDKEHYLRLLRNVAPKEEVTLKLWRDGEHKRIALRPARFDQATALGLARNRWGVGVSGPDADKGVVVSRVVPGTPADQLGLREGDRILKVAGLTMRKKEDFARAFIRFRMQNSLILLVARGERGYYVRLRL